MKQLLILGLSLFVFAHFAQAQTTLEQEKVLAKQYLEKMKAEANTVELENGILMREIYKSKSEVYPSPENSVTVMYSGIDREGKVFDSSFLRDRTATFALAGVIQCWQIALTKMSLGSVYKISCPADTAYGDRGAGPHIKPGAALSFRVVLLETL